MTDVHYVISVLRRHVDGSKGTVDISDAVAHLSNPAEDLSQVLEEPTAMDWHHTALEGLRLLALRDGLTRASGQLVLDATRDIALQFGIDEYYKSLEALAFSPDTAPLLAVFASQQLGNPTLRDARWLAFFAIAALLQRQPEAIPSELAEQLEAASLDEQNQTRQQEMMEIAEQCRSGAGQL